MSASSEHSFRLRENECKGVVTLSQTRWVRSMRRKLDIVHVQADIVVGDDVSDPPDADHGMQMHPDGAQYFVTLATYFFAPL